MPTTDIAPSPLWQWIQLSTYRRPAPPIQHHVGRLWRKGTPPEPEQHAAGRYATERRTAARHTIEEEIADSLQQHLTAWLADPKATVQLVVLPPHLGIENSLRRVAALIRWHVLEPPPFAEILGGGEAWRDRLAAMGDAPVVMPALHRAFLRHADGMDRLRELLAFLRQRRECALVGCESWGWLYLRQALRLGRVFGEPLTLQAFDADRLAQWLPDGSGMSATVLRGLAAESGGNVAVAGALAERIEQSGVAAADATVTTRLWWQSRMPAWPLDSDTMDTFVAHSLLIHGGLPVDALAATILATENEIAAALDRLATAGLIEEAHGAWRVTPVGYPAVRTHLIGHGYADDL